MSTATVAKPEVASAEGTVRLVIDGPVARLTFDRPSARNAMTWRMYEELAAACTTIAADPDVRVAVLRGAGGNAFVAGTDIEQFRAFSSGNDGIAYEEKVDRYVGMLEAFLLNRADPLWVLFALAVMGLSLTARMRTVATPT